MVQMKNLESKKLSCPGQEVALGRLAEAQKSADIRIKRTASQATPISMHASICIHLSSVMALRASLALLGDNYWIGLVSRVT